MFQLIQNTLEDIIVVKNDEEIIIGRENRMFSTTVYYYYVSRKHCSIREHLGALTMMDLGSSNGTFVNGKKSLTKFVSTKETSSHWVECPINLVLSPSS